MSAEQRQKKKRPKTERACVRAVLRGEPFTLDGVSPWEAWKWGMATAKALERRTVDEARFLRPDELAREARVSLSTVRHWLRVGRLPSVKLGRRRVIPRQAFEQMISAGRKS